MEVFLVLNGFELHASIDEQERLMLDLAAGKVGRTQLTSWLETHVKAVGSTTETDA
jgi:death-on-curing protein